jgi:stage IV sporulation protein FA
MKLDFWNKKKKRDEVEVLPWQQNFDPYGDTTRSSLFASGDDDWDVTTSRPVFASRPEAAARARSYEDFLRARTNNRGWDGPASFGGSRRFYDDEDELAGNTSLRRAMQVLGAIALTATLYFTFQSQQPFAQKVQGYVTQAMGQDANVQAIASWWKSNVSDTAAVPVLGSAVPGTSTDKVAVEPIKYVQPVKGKVKTAFDGKDQQGVTFLTVPGAEVKASATGIVEKVDKEGTDDFSITVTHGTNGATVYSHISVVKVKVNDWVDAEHVLGTVAAKGDQAELFFAVQKDGAFIDPAGLLNLKAGE